MHASSMLLLLIFIVVGYVIHPMALPTLQEKGFGLVEDKLGEKNTSGDGVTGADVSLDPFAASEKASGDNSLDRKKNKNQPRITDVETGPVSSPNVAQQKAPKSNKKASNPNSGQTMSENDMLELMQESIKNGDINEFTFDQVGDWKQSKPKWLGGQVYQSGIASYTADTLFGKQDHQARALFVDGKLVKWVWAANDFEMK